MLKEQQGRQFSQVSSNRQNAVKSHLLNSGQALIIQGHLRCQQVIEASYYQQIESSQLSPTRSKHIKDSKERLSIMTDTQSANLRGNPLRQVTKGHKQQLNEIGQL